MGDEEEEKDGWKKDKGGRRKREGKERKEGGERKNTPRTETTKKHRRILREQGNDKHSRTLIIKNR